MSTKKILLTATAIATLAAPGIAQARQGADDPVGHVRHSAGDDVRGVHHSSASKAKHRSRTHRRHGADDGPNHT
jgi:hypothetical protein